MRGILTTYFDHFLTTVMTTTIKTNGFGIYERPYPNKSGMTSLL